MGLTNITFFIFLTLSLIIFYLLPKKYSYISLLVSSIIFLVFDDFSIVKLVYVSIIFFTSYIASILMSKCKSKKIILILAILIILSELIYLKYTNLFILTSNNLFNTNFALVSRESPLGLSYFSLMMISFLVSSYYDEVKLINPLKLLTFMIFFPTITSGPFIKYENIKDSLDKRERFKIDNILDGFIRILWGLFKVLVISTRLNIFVTEVYSNLSTYNPLIVFLTILLYTFELYTNFSGSIDIVIGASKMFGISLPENFNNPFSSPTITEFWRVWHITLGEFLKNYIFYPLLKSNIMQKLTKKCKDLFGKKGKKIPVFLSMFILWLIIGVWHGGEYKYILASGILQFIFILLEDIFNLIGKKRNKFMNFLCMIRTFILFSLSMVFFRASSISEGVSIIGRLFDFNGSFNVNFMSIGNYIIIGVSLLVLLLVDNYKDKIKGLIDKNIEIKLVTIGTLIIVTLLFGMYGLNFVAENFIYGNF